MATLNERVWVDYARHHVAFYVSWGDPPRKTWEQTALVFTEVSPAGKVKEG